MVANGALRWRTGLASGHRIRVCTNQCLQCDCRTTLVELPTEAVLRVCDFLLPLDMLRLGCTCITLHKIIAQDDVWERLCRNRWSRVAQTLNGQPCAKSWRHLFFSGNNWGSSQLQSTVVRRYDDFHGVEFEHTQSTGGTLLTATRSWPEAKIVLEGFKPIIDSLNRCTGMQRRFRSLLPPAFNVHGITTLDDDKVAVSTSSVAGGAALAVLHDTQEIAADQSSDHIATVAGLPTQTIEAPGAVDQGRRIWGVTEKSGARESGFVAVDLEAHQAFSCQDLMSYTFCAWTRHHNDAQVAIALGYAADSTCTACKATDRPSLCEHTGAHPCVMSLIDMRAPRVTDRCPLGHTSCFPRVCNAEGRPPYLFTSHGRAAICAWDLRCLTYPVHEERLDHCIDCPGLKLPAAGRRSHGQGMFLSSHSDFVIGQARNGMTWAWDLSDKLGWAKDSHRRGCWRSFRSSSDARGDWRHPMPLGVIPYFDMDTQAVFAIPGSSNGAFLAIGVTPPDRHPDTCMAGLAEQDRSPMLLPSPATWLDRWPEAVSSWTRSPDVTESVQLFCLEDS